MKDHVSPVSAIASRKMQAYRPPATCRSCQKRVQPFLTDIFSLDFRALAVRGHHITSPESRTGTNIRVDVPTIILPQKTVSPGFMLSRSQRCILNMKVKKAPLSSRPRISPVNWSTWTEARRGSERLTFQVRSGSGKMLTPVTSTPSGRAAATMAATLSAGKGPVPSGTSVK